MAQIRHKRAATQHAIRAEMQRSAIDGFGHDVELQP